MKPSIHSLETLRAEILRLKEEKKIRENQLRLSVKHIGNEMKPANLIKSAFHSVSNDSELTSQLKSKGLEAALGFVVTNLLFKNANPLIRTAATVFGTTFASKLFGEESGKVIEKVKSLYEKFKQHSEKSSKPGEFNEEDIYTS